MRFLVIINIILSTQLFGQESADFFQCATDIFHNDQLATDVQYLSSFQIHEKEYVSSFGDFQKSNRQEFYTLPVVVHIIHNSGNENISNFQVDSAISHLNDAFRNRGYYDPKTGVDTKIQFCLAARDPNAQTTDGITRTASSFTSLEYSTDDLSLKNLNRWNPKEYINIWVVKNICFYGDCHVAGYSSQPHSHSSNLDGIVIESEYFGSSWSLSTAFIHEMGHFLGLSHTFQGGCKNNDCLVDGDRVCDTPPDNITGYFPCNFNYNSCDSDEDDESVNNVFRPISLGGLGDQPDMHQNFMDYGANECFDRFTLGQAERMSYFLENKRNSLIQSYGCLPPCTEPISSLFYLSSTNYFVGDETILNNISSNANLFEWQINQAHYSTATDTTIKFETAGTYIINLIAKSSNAECRADSFSLIVNVVCPTEAQFDYEVVDTSIFLTNNSSNYNAIQWNVYNIENENIFSSSIPFDTFHFDSAGFYSICIKAIGANCIDSMCEFVRIYTMSQENCDNSIDDDGDGLIDLFDTDCTCTIDAYQAQCPVTCQYIPDSIPEIGLKLKWASNQISNYENLSGNIVCADFDNDGKTDILSSTYIGGTIPLPPFSSAINGITIINGENGTPKSNFSFTPSNVRGDLTNIAIGKSRITAAPDIYFFDFVSNKLVCFDFSGNKKWESSSVSFSYGGAVNLADFNGDGIAEVYMNNMVFNAETGKILASGKNGIGGNKPAATWDSYFFAHSIAADLLPSPGLELAAGNSVYSVELNNLSDSVGNKMIATLAGSPIKDGITSVSDIDGDQLLDVIVVRSSEWADGGGVWVWNPRTMSMIASGVPGISGGIPTIGDLDGDCIPEIIVAFSKRLIVYKYIGGNNLEIIYSIPTTDFSGFTCATLFDFNQDGKQEIVYRDETKLMVIEGLSGSIIGSIDLLSGTAMEGPIIADIDNNGSAEILVTGSLNSYNEMRIFAFESDNMPWSPTRTIWNQIGYHVTNIEEDLIVPKEIQNTAIFLPGAENCAQPTCSNPYNNFLAQSTLRTQQGCVQFSASDLGIEIVSANCSYDSIQPCIIIQNHGPGFVSQPIEISVWQENPLVFESAILLSEIINVEIQSLQSDTICLRKLEFLELDSIVVAINDPGSVSPPYSFPLTNFLECNYENNIDILYLDLKRPILDLGPDLYKCVNSVVTLTATEGFDSYIWNDGSNGFQFSTSQAGLYIVAAIDQCGNVHQDSINIFDQPPMTISIGNDTLVCPGEYIALSLNVLVDNVNWFSQEVIDCDTCKTIQVQPDSTVLVIAVFNLNGCVQSDSIIIGIKATEKLLVSVTICEDDEYYFMGDTLKTDGEYLYTNPTCDTTFQINLEVTPTVFANVYREVCKGDSIYIGGVWLKTEGVYSIELESSKGCDSIITLDLGIIEVFQTEQTIEICHGDSVLIGSDWFDTEGYYTISMLNVGGCDSIINLNLIIKENISTDKLATICEGDSIQVGNDWFLDAGNYSIQLENQWGCDSTINLILVTTNTIINTQYLSICQGDSIFINNQWIKSEGIYDDTLHSNPCQEILRTHLAINPPFYNQISSDLCTVDSIWFINQWISDPGEYEVYLQSISGCDSIVYLIVNEIPENPIPEVQVNCEAPSITIVVGDSPWKLNWDNGDTTLQTIYYNGDTVRLRLLLPNCEKEIFIALPLLSELNPIPKMEDTSVIYGQSVSFELNLDSTNWEINWMPNDFINCSTCFNITIFPTYDITMDFSLKHIETGCIFNERFKISIIDANQIYIPSIFSPNKDGVNDFWELVLTNNISFKSVEIFDRWGNMVYNLLNSNNIKWDGTFQNRIVSQGVYTYKLKYLINDRLVTRFGDITILR